MGSLWITMPLVGFITTASFWMPLVTAVEVQLVKFGSTATLACNNSYLYHTTWFKQNPDVPPAVVLSGSLREGQAIQGFQLWPRFSVKMMNRSLAMMITDVEEGDLGLYYCISNVNTRLTVGSGTMLQVSSSDSYQLLNNHWYCMVFGSGLLIMTLAICITHWKAKSNMMTINNPHPHC